MANADDTFEYNVVSSAGGYLWSNPANWSTGLVPVDGDSVVVPNDPANGDSIDDIAGLSLSSLTKYGDVAVTVNLTVADIVDESHTSSILVQPLNANGPVTLTITTDDGGVSLEAIGAGSSIIDQTATNAGHSTDYSQAFAVDDGATIETYAPPADYSTFLGLGTFAFKNPAANNNITLDLEIGSVLELPGSSVSNVNFGAGGLSVTTNLGTYAFTMGTQGSGITGYSYAIDPATGLLAVTFSNINEFQRRAAAASGQLAGDYLWSNAANWSGGLPAQGSSFTVGVAGYDNLAVQTVGTLTLDQGQGGAQVYASNARLSITDVVEAGGKGGLIEADSAVAGGTAVVDISTISSQYINFVADGAGATLFDHAASDPGGNLFSATNHGLIEIGAAPLVSDVYAFGANGTLAFPAAGANNLSLILGLSGGDVMEVPGISVSSVAIGASSVDITTNDGNFAFNGVIFGEPIVDTTTSFDTSTGLEAITFRGVDVFTPKVADANGDYLWSNAANWSEGLPADGDSVTINETTIDSYGDTVAVVIPNVDDIAALTLSSLALGTGVDITGGMLVIGTLGAVTGEAGVQVNIDADATKAGAPVTVSVSHNNIAGGFYSADGPGARFIDNTPPDAATGSLPIYAGYYAAFNGGFIEIPGPQAAEDLGYTNSPTGGLGYGLGALAFTAPVTRSYTPLIGVTPGDVLEFPGSRVSAVSFDFVSVIFQSETLSLETSIAVTTDNGTYTFLEVKPASPIGSYSWADDPTTGLVAITFGAPDTFSDEAAAASGPLAGEYLWSNQANWSDGVPLEGGIANFAAGAIGYDDIASLSLGGLSLNGGAVFVTGASLALGGSSGGRVVADATDTQGTVTVSIATTSAGDTYAAEGAGATLLDLSAYDLGNRFTASSGGLVEFAGTLTSLSTLEYDGFATIALANPGTLIAADLNIHTGDVLELPGDVVNSVSFGAGSLTLSTGAGTYSFSFVNYLETIADYTSSFDTATGLEAITLTGTVIPDLQAAAGQKDVVFSNVSATNPVIAGGTLELASFSTVTGNISFSGTGGVLVIDANPYGSTNIPANRITGFGAGDTIELAGVAFSGTSSDFGAPAADSYTVDNPGTLTIDAAGTIYQLRIAGVTIGQDDFVLSNDLQVTEDTSDEALDYYVRFTSVDGTTLTLDGNQLFALASFSFGATKPLDGIQPSGNVVLDALQLSFGDAALNPSLLAQLASGTAFKEVDILGYRPSDGALISEDSFGLLAGASLTIDQSGVAQYSADYGSVELQHNSTLPGGSLAADTPAAWNSVAKNAGFSTTSSGVNTAPLAAPATLPQTGVGPAGAEALDYYVRFTSADGTTLTLDGNQLFALESFSFGAARPLEGIQQSGSFAFSALQLSFGDAALNPSLFALLASGTAFKEVDVLGYRPSDGALISEDSFGLLEGASLTIDQSGVAQYSAQYGSAELQHNSTLPGGSPAADTPTAWNSVANEPGFSTTPSEVNTAPLAAPATLPQTGVTTAGAENLDYYVRFTSVDGTTMTLDGNQLFALASFSFGATKPLDGIQPSGNAVLDALKLSYGDAALNPSLFAQLASGTAFKEVDVLGYSPSDGALVSEDSFGLLEGASLTIDRSGAAQYSAQYGSAELQHNSTQPGGSLAADTPAAWNSVTHTRGFSTDGSDNTTPLAGPGTLPATGVAPADDALDYYVRFTSVDGTTLTLDGNQLFALASFSFGATKPLDGIQPSGNAVLDALQLSFGDAALNPSLLAQLASGTAFKEVDILGYRPSDGALISEDSFGLLAGASLTIDQSGVAQYSADYGSVELQHNSTLPGGSPAADTPAAWNSVAKNAGFSTTSSGVNTAPLAAPATLPQTGVGPAGAEALDYYVRFTSADGTTLTLDGNQLFALESFSFGAARPLEGIQQSGSFAFNALRLSFGDAALNPSLFAQLASGTAFKEVDVLGYRASDGALISEDSFGLLVGGSLTIDQSGVAQYSAQYGSAELQHNSTLPGGSLAADTPAAWNSVANEPGFSTTPSEVNTAPLAAPATLPQTGVTTAGAENLDYYVRFTSVDGTTMTLDGNQLFALASFSFGATKPLDGIQPSGNVALDALKLSFGDAALNPSLFAQLASGTAFKEVDVLGYSPSDGALVSEDSFGLLEGASLTIGQSGAAQYSANYGSVELQYDTADNNPPCYCRGTRILTARGQIAVEELAIGDRAVTASGGLRPITWLGHRGIDIARHPDPQAVWPVCVSAGAFGPNKPSRDLWLSPGHNIAAEGVLMPVSLLVNGVSVIQHQQPAVEYWHVELDQHDIILAEGLEAESYLDTGNRTAFVNGGGFIEAHPDFAPKHWAQTCVPLVHAGPEITRTKARLIERASEFGFTVTGEADLHILADETRIEPIRLSENRLAFMLPAGCREILLSSNTFVPAHTCSGSQDGRTLGIDVRRLQIDGDEIALDAAFLGGGGWNEPEREGDRLHRWTAGQAPLPACTRLIVLDLNGRGYYWTARRDNVVPILDRRTERRAT